MKTIKLLIAFLTFSAFSFVQAQCPYVSCPPNITVSTSYTTCDAVVNFTTPVGIDTCSSISTTFNYTGSVQTWVVPAGITSIHVDAYGAQGGANWISNTNYGGRIQAVIPVTPGTTISIYVGGQPTGLIGGWNGGGNGETAGIGGGGASDIRIGGTSLSNRYVVAGAGGGAGFWSSQHVVGGVGGGLVGGNGSRVDFATAPGGEGGTQTSSGNGTCGSFNNPICAGSLGQGGAPSSCGCEGYGGGGGWWGGAGSGNCRGGGGGSSFSHPTATNVIHNQGVRMGHGEVIITYANNSSISTSQTLGLISGSVFPLGTTTNSYEVTDGITTSTCSFDIIVIDSIAPTLTVPGDVFSCANDIINNLTPTYSDNCSPTSVTYSVSGATTANGNDDVSGTIFNPGVSDVWYFATDIAGNIDSAKFVVTVYDLPSVVLAQFINDTMCTYYSPVNLPIGSPTAGIYSGNGVVGANFDPASAGLGTHWVTYSYTDTNGCTNNDSTSVTVKGCLGLEENSFENIASISPNPTNGKAIVQLVNKANYLTYTVYSSDGKIVSKAESKDINSFEINLSSKENGIYFIKMNLDNKNYILRLVKQ